MASLSFFFFVCPKGKHAHAPGMCLLQPKEEIQLIKMLSAINKVV